MIRRYFGGRRALLNHPSSFCTNRRKLGSRRPLFETLELRQMLANYTWSDASDTLLISLGNNESLTVTEAAGSVAFKLSSGVFTQSGGNAASGSGTGMITLAAANLASSVKINNSAVATGTNNVTFSGAGSLSSNNIAVDLTDSDAVGTILSSGFNLNSTGLGGITLETVRNILITGNAALTTIDGDITLRANQQLLPTSGVFDGVIVNQGTITTNGKGNILLEGHGGDALAPGAGVYVALTSKVESTAAGPFAGTITINGKGGTGPNANIGVVISGQIISVDGNITITGFGGGDGNGSFNIGVMFSGGRIISTGTGGNAAKITVKGIGGHGTFDSNGVYFIISEITSKDGDIKIIGQFGSGYEVDSDNTGISEVPGLPNPITSLGTAEIYLIEIPAAPQLKVSNAQGKAGFKIPLDIQATPNQTDGNEDFHVIISGVPAGATFWRGNLQVGVNLGNGAWKFTEDLLTDLAIRLPASHQGNVKLTVTARAVEITTGYAGESTEKLTIFVTSIQGVIAVGTESGRSPWVQVIEKSTGAVISKFLAYDASFKGGVRVAVGDLTGDGVAEIIAAQGAGDRNVIRVFTQDGVELKAFRTVAYSVTQGFKGVNVAVGDVDGDGRNDIVVAPSKGKAEIRMFRNEFVAGQNPLKPSKDPIGNPWRRFLAFTKNFTGGAVVAVADMHSGTSNKPLDGRAEIIVGSGAGMRATVRVFNLRLQSPLVKSFFAFSESFRGGISSIDVGRINKDRIPDIVVGAGKGFGSMVRVFDGRTTALISSFRAYSGVSRNAAVRAALLDSNNDGVIDQIVTAQGPGGATRALRSFAPLSGKLVDEIVESDADFNGQYWIGA